jgi:hypothetical protein
MGNMKQRVFSFSENTRFILRYSKNPTYTQS